MSEDKNFSVVSAMAYLDPYTPPPKPYWNTSRSGVRVEIEKASKVGSYDYERASVKLDDVVDKYDAIQLAHFFVALAFKLGHAGHKEAEAFLAKGHND